MELPAWVRVEIRDDLGDPKEAEEQNCVEVLRHVAWTENYESEADNKDVDDQIRLPDVFLLDHGSLIGDRIESKKYAK